MGKLTAWTVPLLLVSTGIVFSPTVQAGGTSDSYWECDVLGIACAAAGAVALSGCAVAEGNITVKFYLDSGMPGIVEIKGKVESCMSLAISRAVSGTDLLVGHMLNRAEAGEHFCNDEACEIVYNPDESEQTELGCQSTLGDSVICGPTGVTYEVPRVACVTAHAHGDANQPIIAQTNPLGIRDLVRPPQVAEARAEANAQSSPCHNLRPGVKIDFGDLLSDPFTSAPFSAVDPTIQESIRSELRATFDQQLAEATASWPDNDLMNLVRAAVVQEAHNAVENFAGDVKVTPLEDTP